MAAVDREALAGHPARLGAGEIAHRMRDRFGSPSVPSGICSRKLSTIARLSNIGAVASERVRPGAPRSRGSSRRPVPRPRRARALRARLSRCSTRTASGNDLRGRRRNADDRAAAAVGEPRRRMTDRGERAVQVQVDFGAERVGVVQQQRPEARPADRRHDDVEAMVERPRAVERGLQVAFVTGVARMDRDAAAGHGVGRCRCVRSSASRRRPISTTAAPSATSACAHAAPMPPAPPVTSAVRPARGAEVRIVQPSSGRS